MGKAYRSIFVGEVDCALKKTHLGGLCHYLVEREFEVYFLERIIPYVRKRLFLDSILRDRSVHSTSEGQFVALSLEAHFTFENVLIDIGKGHLVERVSSHYEITRIGQSLRDPYFLVHFVLSH